MGLWLLQECRRAWARRATTSLRELIELAAGPLGDVPLFDPDDERFLAPGDMPARIAAACERSGQRAAARPRRGRPRRSSSRSRASTAGCSSAWRRVTGRERAPDPRHRRRRAQRPSVPADRRPPGRPCSPARSRPPRWATCSCRRAPPGSSDRSPTCALSRAASAARPSRASRRPRERGRDLSALPGLDRPWRPRPPHDRPEKDTCDRLDARRARGCASSHRDPVVGLRRLGHALRHLPAARPPARRLRAGR